MLSNARVSPVSDSPISKIAVPRLDLSTILPRKAVESTGEFVTNQAKVDVSLQHLGNKQGLGETPVTGSLRSWARATV